MMLRPERLRGCRLDFCYSIMMGRGKGWDVREL
jgi:hypothetical protein